MTGGHLSHTCVHCGKPSHEPIIKNGEVYCCNGCVRVRELLNSAECSIPEPLSKADQEKVSKKYAHLNTPAYRERFIRHNSDGDALVSFFLPDMYCSSCVEFLEHLNRKESAIIQSEVHFPRKELRVRFDEERLSLGGLAGLLAASGYPPELRSAEEQKKKKPWNGLVARIGVAGFCFGNIMLMSFPEYLGADDLDEGFRSAFGWLNLLLSIPVLLFSGWSYLRSAAVALKNRTVNIDVPVSIGIIALFGRSSWEVISGTGIGFFDSFAGLIFFLLIGKWYQARTYGALSYDRDYKSYFPIAVTRRKGKEDAFVPISELQPGDTIVIHHQEIIPADCILESGDARIDYSFVTGESDPQRVPIGKAIQAGGRQTGPSIVAIVERAVEQSKLTRLWNSEAFQKEGGKSIEDPVNRISKHFTWVIMTIALAAFVYWIPTDERTAWNAFTATLIVACPCALALTLPFTFGSVMRLMGKGGMYLKNTSVIEAMSRIQTLVFDKTGTLTRANDYKVIWHGRSLGETEREAIAAVAGQSAHPLSRALSKGYSLDAGRVRQFDEVTGKGIIGLEGDREIKLGSAAWMQVEAVEEAGTQVHVSIDGEYLGFFAFEKPLREGLGDELSTLSQRYELRLLSGDNARDAERFSPFFKASHMHFNQEPADKMAFIEAQKSLGTVAMVGDGLNDAGALRAADFGVAVVDDLYAFSPACDAILHADALHRFDGLLGYAKDAMRVVKRSFLISFLYNAIGIAFAVQGLLTPLVAAILMPLSSVSVVLFTVLSAHYFARKNRLSAD